MDKKEKEIMKILILGATGATGRILLEQLLNRGHRVTAIVRSTTNLPAPLLEHESLTTFEAAVLDLGQEDLSEIVKGCDAVASCLGHNITFKGLFGRPRNLVTQSVIRICQAIKANNPARPVKIVLMNTTANRNRGIKENYSFVDRLVISLIGLLLPPQKDNVRAAEYLRKKIGLNDKHIQWAAVRPDTLIDKDKISTYQIFPSPIRSPLFNAGETSRINVAHFMSHLIVKEEKWNKWKGQMPVIYNIL